MRETAVSENPGLRFPAADGASSNDDPRLLPLDAARVVVSFMSPDAISVVREMVTAPNEIYQKLRECNQKTHLFSAMMEAEGASTTYQNALEAQRTFLDELRQDMQEDKRYCQLEFLKMLCCCPNALIQGVLSFPWALIGCCCEYLEYEARLKEARSPPRYGEFVCMFPYERRVYQYEMRARYGITYSTRDRCTTDKQDECLYGGYCAFFFAPIAQTVLAYKDSNYYREQMGVKLNTLRHHADKQRKSRQRIAPFCMQ